MADISLIPYDRIASLQSDLLLIKSQIANMENEISNHTNELNILSKISFVGMIISSPISYQPNGWLICNGQAVSRTEYNDLFNVIGTQYGNGDGSTTFNIPDCKGLVIQMTDGNQQIGTRIEAGLPNITGSVGQGYNTPNVNGGWHNNSNSGMASSTSAIYLDGTTAGSSCTWQNYGDAGRITLDARRANPIYGKSNTVQPPAFIVNYFIKY